MAISATAQKIRPGHTGDDWAALKQVPFRYVDLDLDENAESVNSADRFRDWDEAYLRELVGVDEEHKAIFRSRPLTAAQVRSIPSSTGNLVEWEGVVEAVLDDSFEARLSAIKGSDVDFEEFTSFDFNRVPNDDHDLIQPGALFRLVLGFQALGGTRQQYSRVTFRRLPAWNKTTIEEASSYFDRLADEIMWSDEDCPTV